MSTEFEDIDGTQSMNRDPIDSGRVLIAAMILGTTGVALFAILPLLVGALVDYLALTPRQSGFVAAADIIGMAAGNLAAFFWIRRISMRKMAWLAVSIIALANLLCITTSSFAMILSLRLLIGLAEGTCLALAYAILGRSSHADRNYAIFIVVIMTFGALNLYILSQLAQIYGAIVFFLDLAIIAAVAGLFVRYIPKRGAVHESREDASHAIVEAVLPVGPAVIVLLAANLVYFVGQGGVWAYLERIGIAHELSVDQVAIGLSMSLITGVAGALATTVINLRFGRAAPLGAAILIAIACVLVLIWNVTVATFFVAVGLWNFVNNFGHPYLLGYMASIDRSGRYVVASGGMQTAGMGVGPAIAALIISSPTYINVLWLGLACFIITLAMFMPIMILYRGTEASSTEPVS